MDLYWIILVRLLTNLYTRQVVIALKEIGAVKSSELIKKAVELLPKDGSLFFNSADETSQSLMKTIDREFSSYPDGFLRNFFRSYAENHKSEILRNKNS